jgi:hypothetical protein
MLSSIAVSQAHADRRLNLALVAASTTYFARPLIGFQFAPVLPFDTFSDI